MRKEDRFDLLFDQLKGAYVFSNIGIRYRYHKLRIKEEDTPKYSFRTRFDHYKFIALSFGKKNAPMAFMNLIRNVLSMFLDSFIQTLK